MNEHRSGLILLDKPSGVTSFRALAPVKKALGYKKLGHTGTLDKFATGLLLLLAGSYTKLNPFFEGLDKRYTGIIRFGKSTSTLDPEGDVTEQGDVPSLSAVEAVLPEFRGALQQVPPAYSAVHVNGTRAYRRALRGEEPELGSRPVSVYHLEIRDWNPPDLTVTVHCSKGTYIRSLARDIGRACGSAAYLCSLRREAVGDFTLEHSVDPEDFRPDRDLLDSAETVALLPGIEVLPVREEAVPFLSRGVPPKREWFTEPPVRDGSYAAEDGDGSLLALLQCTEGRLSYHFVIGRPAA